MLKYKQNNPFQPEDVGASRKLMSDRLNDVAAEKYEQDAIRYVRHNRLTTRGIVILCAVGLVLILLLLYFVPWPTHIRLTMTGVELSSEGTVIAAGEMYVEAWKYDYLFKHDEFYVTDLRLPGQEVRYVHEYMLAHLIHPRYLDIYYTGFAAAFAGEELESGTVFFTADQSGWAFDINGRTFVGSTGRNPNYAAIAEGFGL